MGCNWDTLNKHKCPQIIVWDMPNLGLTKRTGIHCKRLCTFEKYENVCIEGFQANFGLGK